MSCCGGKCSAGVDPSHTPFGKKSGEGRSRYPVPLPSMLRGTWKQDPAFPQFSVASSSTKASDNDDDEYTYEGSRLCAVDFPLGGFGTGHLFLQGDGTLGQFAIVNQVKEETEPVACMPSCFFGIQGETTSGTSLGQFVLSAPTTYESRQGRAPSPHAVKRLQALPGIRSLTMRAQYPRANVSYDVASTPLEISMEAISPLVPGDVKNSSLPLAIFTFTIKNSSSTDAATVRVLQTQQNFVGWNGHDDCTSGTNKSWGGNVNAVMRIDGSGNDGGVLLHNPSIATSAESFGTISIGSMSTATTTALTSVIAQAKDETDLWTQFVSKDDVPLASAKDSSPSSASFSWSAGVVQTVTVQPNGTATVRFALTWHFPNRMRDTSVGSAYANILPSVLGNYYSSKWFSDAPDVFTYAASQVDAYLLPLTKTFVETAYATSIPSALLDSAVGRLAVLRSPTMWRNADGTVLGCEGNGCCPLNCTHVYGYTTLIERLYPSLAKDMRESDFVRNFDISKGGCTMRFGTGGWAIDGALACVIKTYLVVRQADNDSSWLSTVWPNVLKQMQYIMDTFDVSGDGVIRSAQQNTYDTAMYGANTFIGSYYITALRASAAMATLMKDSKNASMFLDRAKLSATNYDKICFESDFGYYIADVTSKDCKYSYGPGCFVDQICAAGLSLACGFGYLMDETHEKSARKAIVANNIVTMPPFNDLQKHFFPGDTGITVCTYPNGKLGDGMMYENLVSSGFTSPVIAGLIFDDNLDDATKVTGFIRQRHDGRNRSPWNEPECNLLYSRAMAHWNLLDQSCGFAFDATTGALKVVPTSSVVAWNKNGHAFNALVVLPNGWGQYVLSKNGRTASLTSQCGTLQFSSLRISINATAVTATLGGQAVNVQTDGTGLFTFPSGSISIGQGDALVLSLTPSRVQIRMSCVDAQKCCPSAKKRTPFVHVDEADRVVSYGWLVAVLMAFVLGLALGGGFERLF